MNKIEFGDNREIMKQWAADGVKVQTCVTSPPYFGLRDYSTAKWVGGNGDDTCDHIERIAAHGGERADRDQTSQVFQYKSVCGKCGATREDKQLGLEETPDEYIENMVDVFRHVRDILADDGTIWVNIGDSYAGSGKGQTANGSADPKQPKLDGMRLPVHRPSSQNTSTLGGGKDSQKNALRSYENVNSGLPAKNLIGIPWRLALALQADGWILRQDIIWHKPNPMPESVTDRCGKAHEYIFLLSKKPKYYFDHISIKEPVSQATISDGRTTRGTRGTKGEYAAVDGNCGFSPDGLRNKRSVWSVNTKPYKGAHFAVYPEELITPCILAGSKFGDVVFDPFMGSGTTAAVAIKHGRQYMGCELNPSYGPLQQQRIDEATKTKPPIIDGDPDSLFSFENNS